MKDVIVLGGGAAGLAAALYAARYNLDTICIAKDFGGTGKEAHKIDNWIGNPEVSGVELMDKFIAHVKSYQVNMIRSDVSEIKRIEDGFMVLCDKGEFKAKTIIYALGMKHRHLNVLGEEKAGVHYCYTCDGPFYRNKVVGVVGGSDSAALAALMLKDYASKVYVIYRRDKLRAEPISAKKVYDDDKIEVIHNSNVVEVMGDKRLNSVKLDNGNTLQLDGLFIEIGHLPVNDLVKNLGVEMDEKGFIKVSKNHSTNVPGFFAAGDITDASELKQLITSAAEGSKAAQGAYRFLK